MSKGKIAKNTVLSPRHLDKLIGEATVDCYKNGKVAFERLYWDQASLLVQVGLLDPGNLPVVGIEQARRLLRVTAAESEPDRKAQNVVTSFPGGSMSSAGSPP